MPTWRNLRDVEVVGITRWLDNRLPIESVNGETAHRHLRPPEPLCALSRSRATAPRALGLLGGERVRGAGHARPVVSRSPARAALLPAADRERTWRRPRSSRRGCRKWCGWSGVRARRSMTCALKASLFAHTEWQPPADYASSLQAGIEVPGALCSITPSDAPSPAAASSTSATTASRWAWAARTSRSRATGSRTSERGESGSATSSRGRRTGLAN